MAEIKKEIKTSIGGQALLEGIMMRGPKKTAMAVRHVSGEIRTDEWDTAPKNVAKIWKWPLFRGMYAMVSSFSLGYKCLIRSAEMSGIDEMAEMEDQQKKLEKINKKRAKKGLPPVSSIEETKETAPVENDVFSKEETKETAPVENDVSLKDETEEPVLLKENTAVEDDAPQQEPQGQTSDDGQKKKEEKKNTSAIMAVAASIGSVLGVLLAIVLFIWLPSQLYSITLSEAVDSAIDASYPKMLIRSLFEGFLRILLFIGYMVGVSFMKDIHRTFMYHGAEHKTIFCYEKGLPLTVENVRTMCRFHPRCGTSFMIVMMIIGIILGSFIPELHLGSTFLSNVVRSVIKLLLLPLTVGLGYEFIKYAGKHDNLLVKILSAPGLWMQRISTKNPDDDMIECAIVAIQKVIPDDGSDEL